MALILFCGPLTRAILGQQLLRLLWSYFELLTHTAQCRWKTPAGLQTLQRSGRCWTRSSLRVEASMSATMSVGACRT